MIHEQKARGAEPLSFTAFIAACLGKAVDEDKSVQAYRREGTSLYSFRMWISASWWNMRWRGKRFPCPTWCGPPIAKPPGRFTRRSGPFRSYTPQKCSQYRGWCNPFLHAKGTSVPTRILVQIPLMECRLLEHESLCQRFIHAGLLKARESAWPEVAQRIMNY